MMRRLQGVLGLTLFLGITTGLGIFFGCAKSTSTAAATYSYGGPGSAYTAVLNGDLTFTITHAPSHGAAVDFTITGTYSRLTSGFVKLTVVTVTGAGGPVAGDTAYGLEVPGFAFLVKPVGDDSNVIPMVASGSCPTSNLTLNWIAGDKDDAVSATSASADFFGTFSYNATGNTATLPNKYALAGPYTSLGSGTVGTLGTCAGGILDFTNGSMWLTSLGGALVHSGTSSTNDQTIIAMPSTAITTTTGLVGSYAGLVFNKSQSSGNSHRIFPVALTATAPTTTTLAATGTELTNVETGTTGTGVAGIAITAIDSPSTGFMTGTITISSQTGLMACMASANVVSSGKNMIFCVSQSPDNNTEPFNLLLVSK